MSDFLCEINWINGTSNTILHVGAETMDDAVIDLIKMVNPNMKTIDILVRITIGIHPPEYSEPTMYRIIAGRLYECKLNKSPIRHLTLTPEEKRELEGRCEEIW